MSLENSEDNPDPKREEEETDQNQGKPDQQISATPAEPETPPPNTNGKKPHKCKKHWLEYATFAVEIFGLIGLAIYALLTLGIYQESKKSAAASVCSANAAQASAQISKEAVEITRDQMRLDQRAWIAVKDIHGPPSSPVVTFLDTGKTPARKVIMFQSSQWVASGVLPSFEVKGKGKRLGLLSPVTERTANQQTGVQSQQWPILYVWGTFTYEDIFKQPHWTTFCAHITAGDQFWNFCEQHNDTDEAVTLKPSANPIAEPKPCPVAPYLPISDMCANRFVARLHI
jgi:hypothetical protein